MTFTIRRPGAFEAEFETITIEVERRFEHDINFMQDRFVYLARSGGQQGYSAVGLGYGALEEQAEQVADHIRGILPEMRRTAIDGALGLGYEKDLRRAGNEVVRLQDEIRFLRRPLRRKVADWTLDLWCRVKAVFA